MYRYVKGSEESAFIGIWWYTDAGEVIGYMCPLKDGIDTGSCTEYDPKENHLSLWKRVCNDYFEEPERSRIYSKGYRGLERGRVYYDNRTHSFVITCSKAIITNVEFKYAIIGAFNLTHCRYDFVALDHYNKIELTGNPALDNFEFGL